LLETRLAPAAIVWTGAHSAVDLNWSDGLNWQGNVVPGPGDVATFNGATSNLNSHINLAFGGSVLGINIQGGYTGTINDGLGTLTIGASGYTQAIGTFNLNGNALNLTAGGGVTISGGKLTSGAGTINVSGNWTKTGGSFVAGTGIVNFTAASGLQTLAAGSSAFNNVEHSGAGTLQLSTTGLTVNGSLLNSAGTLDASTRAVTVAAQTMLTGGQYLGSTAAQNFQGGLDVAGGTFNASTGAVNTGDVLLSAGALNASGAGAFNVSGNWSVTGGTFSPGAGVITFTGTGTETLNSGGAAFNKLSHTGTGTLQLSSDLTVNSTLVNAAGAGDFDTAGHNLTVGGLTTLSGGNFLASTGTHHFTGLTIAGGTFVGSSGAVNTTSVTLSSGSLLAPTGDFNVGGDWLDTGGTFTAGTGTVTFNGVSSSQQLDSGGNAFNNIVHSGISTLKLVNHDLSVLGTLTATAGTIFANTQNLTVAGLATLTDSTFQGATGLQKFNGGLSLTGATVNTAPTGLVQLGGDVTATSDGAGLRSAVFGKFSLGSATRTFTVLAGPGAKDLVLSCVISGDPGVGLVKAGAGLMVLTNPSNSFDGGVVLNAGTLETASDFSLGTGPLTLNAGTIADNGFASVLSSLVTVNGSVTAAPAVSLDFTNAVSGAGSLTVAGPGTLILGGAVTVAGLTVNGGTLEVDGNAAGTPVAVNAGGTLTGTGTVGAVTATGGTVQPGTPAGTLHTTDFSLNSTSTYAVQLNGSTPGPSAEVEANGVVHLGLAVLSPSLGASSAYGDTFEILDDDGPGAIQGTFQDSLGNDLPEGGFIVLGGDHYRITYVGGDGNDIVLTHLRPDLVISAGDFSSAEGLDSGNQTVATFTDPGGAQDVGEYQAAIDWGDSNTSPGTILTDGNGQFYVVGSHAYAEEGTYAVAVHVSGVQSFGGHGSASLTADVADALLHDATATGSLAATEGIALTGAVVSFTDDNPLATPADFQATILWGDGHMTAGQVVTNGSGGFDVTGSNTYAEEGSYAMTVFITDAGDSALSLGRTVAVADAVVAQGATFGAKEGKSFSNVVVTTFTDADANGALGEYSATIDWGDGSGTSAGTILAGAGGTFHVVGSHRYEEEGTFAVTVTIADEGTSTVAHSSARVADAALQVTATDPVSATANVSFTQVLTTFSDSDPHGALGDYTATIFWGDNSTSAGTVTANGAQFDVSGTHTYTQPGGYLIQVVIQDAGGASVTASLAANVGGTLPSPGAPEQPASALTGRLLENSSDAGGKTVVRPGAVAHLLWDSRATGAQSTSISGLRSEAHTFDASAIGHDAVLEVIARDIAGQGRPPVGREGAAETDLAFGIADARPVEVRWGNPWQSV
jgi:autotransporter-associated beta strand protein